MDNLNKLISFLDEMEKRKIYYTLDKIRDGILVCIVVPGERWELEFLYDGKVECEKFLSNGEIYNEVQMEELFKSFSD